MDRFTTPIERAYAKRCPRTTIWGHVDKSYRIPGCPIWYVETPGHGGYVVDTGYARDNLSTAAQDIGDGGYGANGGADYYGFMYFEEDCAWAVVEYELLNVQAWALANFRPVGSYTPESYIERIKEVLALYFPEMLTEEPTDQAAFLSFCGAA